MLAGLPRETKHQPWQASLQLDPLTPLDSRLGVRKNEGKGPERAAELPSLDQKELVSAPSPHLTVCKLFTGSVANSTQQDRPATLLEPSR